MSVTNEHLASHVRAAAKKDARKIIVMEQGWIVSAIHSEDSLVNFDIDMQPLQQPGDEDKLDQSLIPTSVDSATYSHHQSNQFEIERKFFM